MYQRLHSSITLEIWKRSARQIHSCWPLAALPAPWTLTSSLCPGPCRPLLPWVCSWSGLVFRCARVCLQPSSCVSVLPPLMCRSEQLRRLAVQLASLAFLEDVVIHGIQSLLASPVTANERALRASLSRPHSRSLSLTQGCPEPPRVDLARQRAPTGLARPSALAPPVTFPTLRLLLLIPRSPRAPLALVAKPSPRLAPRLLTPPASAARLARRRSSAPLGQGGAVAICDGGAHGGMRNGPCRAGFSFKPSSAPPRGIAASPVNDEHNTSNYFLCAHALIGPVLLTGLTETDELKVALGCRVLPWTSSPSSRDTPSPIKKEPLICDLGPRLGADLPVLSLQHGWTCTRLRVASC